ncbi:unnamed protein product [Oppiella nova]|uniref:Lysosome membrane protein 2 n=1 Tax=Oppiella nova TaxID=334625 RepID=A0A7R9LY49_9ACAR|nr:unnamed protein product [Oppiella nova]CAG2168048.1 unnamed protein product [Oppiella nova]
MGKIVYGIILAVGLVLVIGGAVILGILPGIIKDKIKEEVPITDGSDAYDRWQETPVPLYMKFTFFELKNTNYTNLQDIEFVEKGPYVFKETRFKQNITFLDDDNLLSYLENRTYEFSAKMSCKGCKENDSVTFINFPMMGKNLLEKEWTIYTGKKDTAQIGQMTSFDHMPYLENHMDNTSIWDKDMTNTTCNKLKGTDGTMFKPDLKKDDVIYAFEPQLCRTVYFDYWKESEVQNIDTLRFRVPKRYSENPNINKDNTCYCIRDDIKKQCSRNGLLEIAHCQRRSIGAPIVMSSPYWNNGDDSLLKQFNVEIKPPKERNDDNYGTYLDIEPMTGTTLRAYKRMQMNLRISGTDKFKPFLPQLTNTKDYTKEYIVPAFWVEETAEADEEQADKWKSMVGTPKKVGNGVSIAACVVGAIMTIAAIYLFEVPITEGSDAYDRWQKTPVPLYMAFRFFTLKYTNFTSLDDLQFQEKGPYVYKEERTKVNVNFTDDGNQASYYEHKVYSFSEGKSCKGCKESDKLTFINFPILGIAFNTGFQDITGDMVKFYFSTQLQLKNIPVNESQLFITAPVVDILFTGVPYKMFEILSGMSPDIPKRYGVSDGKILDEEEWTVYTGKKDIAQLGQITSFDHKTSLTNEDKNHSVVWKKDTKAETCNKLKGTDGSIFAPDLTKDDIVYAFEPQLCRTVYFKYWKETSVQDIDTYRFRVPRDYFENPNINDKNTCYCLYDDIKKQCSRSGLLDISHCQRRSLGGPIIMSSPYWNNGDDSLLNQFKVPIVPPQERNDDNYGTLLDIEPMTGNTLRAYRRMQMNVKLSGSDAYKDVMPELTKTNKTKEYIIPAFWVEETAEADEDQADKWKSMVGTPKKVANGVSIAACVVGAIMTIAAIYLFIRNR